MSNEKFKIGNLSGKGLIIAVAASIVVVGAAGFYSYSKISDKLNAEIIGENKDTLSADGAKIDGVSSDGDGAVLCQEPEPAEHAPEGQRPGGHPAAVRCTPWVCSDGAGLFPGGA